MKTNPLCIILLKWTLKTEWINKEKLRLRFEAKKRHSTGHSIQYISLICEHHPINTAGIGTHPSFKHLWQNVIASWGTGTLDTAFRIQIHLTCCVWWSQCGQFELLSDVVYRDRWVQMVGFVRESSVVRDFVLPSSKFATSTFSLTELRLTRSSFFYLADPTISTFIGGALFRYTTMTVIDFGVLGQVHSSLSWYSIYISGAMNIYNHTKDIGFPECTQAKKS